MSISKNSINQRSPVLEHSGSGEDLRVSRVPTSSPPQAIESLPSYNFYKCPSLSSVTFSFLGIQCSPLSPKKWLIHEPPITRKLVLLLHITPKTVPTPKLIWYSSFLQDQSDILHLFLLVTPLTSHNFTSSDLVS